MTSDKMIAFKILYEKSDLEWPFFSVVSEDENQISINLGDYVPLQDHQGFIIEERDYRVDGEVWQVHKTDADPFPSQPHAHCVGGKQRMIGMKLHLGTRALYDGRRPIGRFLPQKPFDRLITLIQPKFPDIRLPL